MKTGWRRRDAVLALGACAAWPAMAEPGVDAREIVIGRSIALQDGRNAYGVAVAEGTQWALDAANAAGGVNGRRIVLRSLDDANDSARAAANAKTLIDAGVFALFGTIEGGPCTAVAQVAGAASVPFFGPMAGSPTLRRPHQRMVFPVRAEHRDEFRALMTYGRSLGITSTGFMLSDTEVGQMHLENVRRIAADLSMQVVLALPFKGTPDDAALEAMLGRVRSAAPGMLFNHGSAGVYRRLVERVRRAGLRTAVMGVNSGSTEIARDLGPLGHGMVFSQVVPSPWERKHAIVRDYQDAARGARPDAVFGYGSLEGYLTTRALLLALERAGKSPTRASFVSALEQSDFDIGGVRMRWRPDDHGGSTYVDLAMVARDGRFIH